MAIEIEETFSCTADELWAVVGDVGRADWVPNVESCQLDGDVRRMVMAGAGNVAEQILRVDPEERLVEYSVIESTPPLGSHRASIRVTAPESGARLVWRTRVDPEAVEPFIRSAMAASIERLHELLDR